MQIQGSDLEHPTFQKQLWVSGKRQQTKPCRACKPHCASYCFFLASKGFSSQGYIPLHCSQCPIRTAHSHSALWDNTPSLSHFPLCFRPLISNHSWPLLLLSSNLSYSIGPTQCCWLFPLPLCSQDQVPTWSPSFLCLWGCFPSARHDRPHQHWAL